jgi:hypothetical protein
MSGLLSSKWAIPGVDPIRDRKARGLPGTPLAAGEAMFRSRRRKVIRDIRRRVEDGTARDERHAIKLEELRGKRSLDWLCKTLKPRRRPVYNFFFLLLLLLFFIFYYLIYTDHVCI